MTRTVAWGFLLSACGALSGCDGTANPSLPPIEPKAMAAQAAELPEALGATMEAPVVASRRESGEGNATYVNRDDPATDLSAKLPESIVRFEPQEVAVNPETVVLHLRVGEGGRHFGYVVFLPAAPKDAVARAVTNLNLEEVDREAGVYKFERLSDYSMIADEMHPLP